MQYLVIDLTADVPVYIQIMDQIRGLIRDGTLVPGNPLPSVRQLATDLSLNPNTVARAYNLLEREGTLRTAGRRGTFVSDSAPETVHEALQGRLEQVVDQIVERTTSLGIEGKDLLEALRTRLKDHKERSTS